ncbi:MAG: helix-turn-helix transcriptional regulator [Anaerolineales bacterium]|nr:helix-turn-helix transcriptional regulator [Anaerolineales bacterium]
MDPYDLGRQVLQRRKEIGLSQGGLAEKAGISRNYVSLIERGEARNVSTKMVGQLAIALDTTPVNLMGQQDKYDVLIPMALREFGLHAGLSFETIDRLARIPRRGHGPKSAEQWKELYESIRPYLEGSTD